MRRHRILLVLLAAYGLLAGSYSLHTPLFEAPDAYYHFAVIEYTARVGQRPPTDNAGAQPWRQAVFHAPLYHAIAALLIRPIDTSDFYTRYPLNPHAQVGEPDAPDNRNFVAHTGDPWRGAGLAARVVRGFSLLLGAVTLIGVYALARAVFPRRRGLAPLAALVVLLNPQFLYLSGSINNDNLVIALSTVGLALLAHIVREGVTWRLLLPLTVVLALNSLAKASGMALYPVAAAGILYVCWRDRVPLNRIAAYAINGLAMWGLIAAWWYWQNYDLYGDFTATGILAETTGARGPNGTVDFVGELRGLYYSFWGLFGWFNIRAPGIFYTWTAVLLIAAGAGLVLGVVGPHPKPLSRWARVLSRWERGLTAALRSVSPARSNRGMRADHEVAQSNMMAGDLRRSTRDDWVLGGLLGLYALIVIGSWLHFNALVAAGQGRLWFPLLGGLACAVAAGLSALRWRTVGGALLAGMAVGAVAFPLTEIAPAYESSEQIPVAEWTPPPDAVPMPLREPFNAEGRACGVLWVVPPEWAGSAEPVMVDVYWEARCEFDMYWSAFIHFSDLTRETCTAGDTGHILAQHDSMPDGGNTPLPALKVGYVLPDTLTVTPPEGLDVTRDWHVQIGLYDAAGGTFIRAFILNDVGDREAEAEGTEQVFVGRCAPETVVIALPAGE